MAAQEGIRQDWLEKDFYKVLGVPKDADAGTIKKAYRKLAREHHPDKNPDNKAAEERFKAVSEAYDVLSDAKTRKQYDEARDLFASGGGQFGSPFGGRGGFGRGARGTGQGGFSMSDLGDLFGRGGDDSGLGDLFGGIFSRGGGGSTARGPRRGQDIESSVTIGFDEALGGVTLPLRLTSEGPCPSCFGTGAKAGTTPRVCETCGGSGQTSRNAGGFAFAEPCQDCRGRGLKIDDPCPQCHGSGRAPSTRTIQARLPAGVSDGQRIRLKGKGAPGEHGGPNGDLYVVVKVSKHPVFGRDGDNLTLTLPISFDEAALGADVKAPVPAGGTVTLKVPAGTANGRTFRVRGRGAPRRDGSKGDLLVTVDLRVPAELSAQARAAIEAFRAAQSASGSGDVLRSGLMRSAGGNGG